MSSPRWRGFVGLGVGLANFDAAVPVMVEDCAFESDPEGCLAEEPGAASGVRQDLIAVHRLGPLFVALSGGVQWVLAGHDGLWLRTSAIYAFPDARFVLQPSLGFVHGW